MNSGGWEKTSPKGPACLGKTLSERARRNASKRSTKCCVVSVLISIFEAAKLLKSTLICKAGQETTRAVEVHIED